MQIANYPRHAWLFFCFLFILSFILSTTTFTTTTLFFAFSKNMTFSYILPQLHSTGCIVQTILSLLWFHLLFHWLFWWCSLNSFKALFPELSKCYVTRRILTVTSIYDRVELFILEIHMNVTIAYIKIIDLEHRIDMKHAVIILIVKV